MGIHASTNGSGSDLNDWRQESSPGGALHDEEELLKLACGVALRGVEKLPHDKRYTLNVWVESAADQDGLQPGDWIRLATMLTPDDDPEPGTRGTHEPFLAAWEGASDAFVTAEIEVDRDDLTGDEQQILGFLAQEAADAIVATAHPGGHHRIWMRGYSANDRDGYGPGDLMVMNIELLPDLAAERAANIVPDDEGEAGAVAEMPAAKPRRRRLGR